MLRDGSRSDLALPVVYVKGSLHVHKDHRCDHRVATPGTNHPGGTEPSGQKK